ncbi:MAG: rRNA pseudouridine synthase [Oscillospiraceae bacterium]|nr:rRNA pseudouridine synthase [Oscillospiraceae bacterium]
MQRLDKLLSEAGVASRKELKNIIRAGRVTVDSIVVRSPEQKVDEQTAAVCVDGQRVGKQRMILLMLHKPAGFVTSTDDPRDPTVMELIPPEYAYLRPMPVGRLDKDTEGLLLFTNDGQLAHRILSPKKEVWKRYYAEHEGEAGEDDIKAFADGIELKDGDICRPAKLIPQGAGKSLVEICEGKYHQVRRMLASRGMPVTYLKRISEAGLVLGDLPLGHCREVEVSELQL